jgi:class 3 adenylate cyclase
VFTDIEGSTRLLDDLGPENYRDALANHQLAIRDAFGRHDGYEVDSAGDGFSTRSRQRSERRMRSAKLWRRWLTDRLLKA